MVALVWDDAPIFSEKIKAWANGPVVPSLYQAHKGRFNVDETHIGGDSDSLSESESQTVLAVLKYYGDKSGQWLSEVTHQEPPWAEARKGLKPGERGSSEISKSAMAEYYGSLLTPSA